MATRLDVKWAVDNGWIQRCPCNGISLPRETAGRKVNRTALSPDQITTIAERLQEPYATFVLFHTAQNCELARRSQ